MFSEWQRLFVKIKFTLLLNLQTLIQLYKSHSEQNLVTKHH